MKETVILEKTNYNVEGLSVRIVTSTTRAFRKKNVRLCRFHTHPDVELLYIKEGDTTIELIDGKKYCVKAGEIACINSNVAHVTYVTEDCYVQHDMIQFLPNLLDKKKFNFYDCLNLFPRNDQVPVMIISSIDFLQMFFNSCNYYEKKPSARHLYLASNIYGIMAYFHETDFLREALSDSDKIKYIKLAPALEYISNHYAEDISLQTVSKTVHMSDYYFCRIFKKTIGIGFIEFLKQYRINRAELDLMDSEKSIFEIAFDNGFSSSSYFNRVFKEEKNCSPSEYRKYLKEASILQKLTYQ